MLSVILRVTTKEKTKNIYKKRNKMESKWYTKKKSIAKQGSNGESRNKKGIRHRRNDKLQKFFLISNYFKCK